MKTDTRARILALLATASTGLFRSVIAKRLAVTNDEAGDVLAALNVEGLVHCTHRGGWNIGASPSRVAIAEAAEIIAAMLDTAEEPLAVATISTAHGFTPQTTANALRLLSAAGRARPFDVSTGERRQRWVGSKVVRLKRGTAGHMLNEHGDRDSECASYTQCLDGATRAKFSLARCPVNCTARTTPTQGSELMQLAGSRRAVQW